MVLTVLTAQVVNSGLTGCQKSANKVLTWC